MTCYLRLNFRGCSLQQIISKCKNHSETRAQGQPWCPFTQMRGHREPANEDLDSGRARPAPQPRWRKPEPGALTLEEEVVRSRALQSGLRFVAAPVHLQCFLNGAEDHLLLKKQKAGLLRGKLCWLESTRRLLTAQNGTSSEEAQAQSGPVSTH